MSPESSLRKPLTIEIVENPDLACTSCCYAMALNFLLGTNLGLNDLDRITGREPGKPSFLTTSIYRLSQAYPQLLIQQIEGFDYVRFAREGRPVLVELIGEDLTRKSGLDIEEHQKIAQLFFEKSQLSTEDRIPGLEDIKIAFNQRKMVMAGLNHADKYSQVKATFQHLVLITSITDQEITFIDPGYTNTQTGHRFPGQITTLSLKTFIEAWGPENDISLTIFSL